MANMREVAERAGVSITTVSHVVNQTRFVSEELVTRVRNAIEELSYQPDQRARSLRVGKSETIAMMVTDIVNPFFPAVVRGSEDCAREHGYSLILCNTDEDPSQEEVYVSLMMERRVDGFLIAPSMRPEMTLKPLIDQRVPLVMIDRRCSLPVDQVYSDNETGAYAATKHLIDLGHTRIGAIVELEGIPSFDDRVKGWRRALEEAGITLHPEWLRQAGLEVAGATAAAARLLGESAVTAIFATNNLMTLGALEFLKLAGLRCPRDVSLVGFDDPKWAATVNPAITSVAQVPYEMGYKGADLLIKRIEGDKSPLAHICLPCDLRVRESCKEIDAGHFDS
jgi:DNA-binding LacI/PurR family transcriptional regulator